MNINMIEQSTEFGRHVHKRLAEERIIWLTTLDSKNTPQPKYEAGFKRINMTAVQFKQNDNTAIRIRPLKLRGH